MTPEQIRIDGETVYVVYSDNSVEDLETDIEHPEEAERLAWEYRMAFNITKPVEHD